MGAPSEPDSNTPAGAGQRMPAEFPTIGILGGGQLGRMLTTAALRLGLQVRIYQDTDSGPAAASRVFTGSWHDEQLLSRFMDGCDVITLDNEWVELETILRLAPPELRLWPSPETMSLVSDKLRQKDHARERGLPVGPYRACGSEAELDEAAATMGYPLMVKRPRQSYDGYGNRTARDRGELQEAFAALGADGRVLVEQWVPFERELAVIVARRPGGEDVAYPVAATLQRDHRCEAVEVPAPVSDALVGKAAVLARQAAAAYGCVGVVGVEMFALADGTVLLNEIAPRPHNTGHYTIDACVTSQFENHLRAILDLPLGDPSMLRPAVAMVNVLGHRHGISSPAALAATLSVQGAAVHIYDKREVRPGRKMGHVTVVADDLDDARTRAYAAAQRLEL